MIDYSTCSHSTYCYVPRWAGQSDGDGFACEDCGASVNVATR